MLVFGILLGLFLAGGFACWVTAALVNKSNVLGDTKGSFEEFANDSFRMINRKDGVSDMGW